MGQSRTKFVPVKCCVTVSATDTASGKVVAIAQHICRDRVVGRELLTTLGEIIADVGEFIPGLSVAGYELSDAVEVPEALAALSAALPAGRDAGWWARAIGANIPNE